MKYSDLFSEFPKPGRLVWIGLRQAKDGPIKTVDAVFADLESGLLGDRYQGSSGKRQVTLIQYEHIAVLEALTGRAVSPEMLRRNLVVAGINLLALRKGRFQIGEVRLESTGPCHPCSKMEAALGPGGFNAMRGHGGLTARVIASGTMRVGDTVSALPVDART